MKIAEDIFKTTSASPNHQSHLIHQSINKISSIFYQILPIVASLKDFSNASPVSTTHSRITSNAFGYSITNLDKLARKTKKKRNAIMYKELLVFYELL